MIQLQFPFVKDFGRTLPPREITSIGLSNPYCVDIYNQLKLFSIRHSQSLNRNLRKKLFRINPFPNCYYCNDKLDCNTATLEHLIPRTFGGQSNIDNVALSCAHCNTLRDNAPIEVWKNKMKHKSRYIDFLKMNKILKLNRKYIRG